MIIVPIEKPQSHPLTPLYFFHFLPHPISFNFLHMFPQMCCFNPILSPHTHFPFSAGALASFTLTRALPLLPPHLLQAIHNFSPSDLFQMQPSSCTTCFNMPMLSMQVLTSCHKANRLQLQAAAQISTLTSQPLAWNAPLLFLPFKETMQSSTEMSSPLQSLC